MFLKGLVDPPGAAVDDVIHLGHVVGVAVEADPVGRNNIYQSNGKKATVNRALDGSTNPG